MVARLEEGAWQVPLLLRFRILDDRPALTDSHAVQTRQGQGVREAMGEKAEMARRGSATQPARDVTATQS